MQDLRKLLRLQEEPCVYINDIEVHTILMEHREDFFNHFERGFGFWAGNPERVMITPKQIYSSPGIRGDFRVMPCSIHGSEGSINTVKLVGTNEEEQEIKDKISVGKAAIFHPTDNYVMGIVDACILSSARTGASAALAFKHLAGKARKVGIVGCGRVGYYSTEFISLFPQVETFICYDNNPMNIDCFRELLKARNIHCEFPGTLEEVKRKADSLVLSTYSPDPLVYAKDVRNGNIRFISSSGADADNLSELCEDLAPDVSTIYVDTVHSLKVADLKRWKDKGLIKEEQIIEIKDVIGNKVKPDPSVMSLYITTGFAFLDCLTLNYLYSYVSQKERTFQVK